MGLVGWFDSLELERVRGLGRPSRLSMLSCVTEGGGTLHNSRGEFWLNLGARLFRTSHLLRRPACPMSGFIRKNETRYFRYGPLFCCPDQIKWNSPSDRGKLVSIRLYILG